MPTVPRLTTSIQQQGFKIAQGNPNVPVEAFGGGASFEKLNQASQNFTNTFGEIQKNEFDRANKIVLEEADNETLRFKNDSFWNLKDGAITRKGKDSFGTVEEYGQKFDDFADKIEEGLANDTQKQMYRLRRQDRKNELLDQLQKHTYAEGTKYQEEVINSKMSTIQDDLRLNYNEPDRVVVGEDGTRKVVSKIRQGIDDQFKLIDELAAGNGQSSDWVELKKKEIESQTHTDVVKRMLSLGNDLDAGKYFKQNEKAFTGKDTDALNGALEEGSTRGQSQRISDTLSSKYSDPAQAYAEARNISNPKLRDAVEQRLEHQFNVRKSLESEARNQLYMKAANSIEANPGVPVRDAVDPSDWARLTPEQRRSLSERSNDPANDNKAWLDFLDLDDRKISKMTREEFETKYWTKFDSSHRTRAEAKWDAMRDGGGSGSGKGGKHNALLSDTKLVLMAAKEAKIGDIEATDTLKDINGDEDKTTAFTEFQNQAADRFSDFYNENKRDPSHEEKKKILKDLQLKVTIEDPRWYRSNTVIQKYQLNEETKPLARVPIKDIPDDYRNAMFDLAKKNGLIPYNTTRDQAMIKFQKQYERAYGQYQHRKLSNSEVLSILREGLK